MKRITTNQELIVGRKYICRNKIPYANGEYQINISECGEHELRRRYVGPGKLWAYDEKDRIITYNGAMRIAGILNANVWDVISYLNANPTCIQYNAVHLIDSDFEHNSQALAMYDIIGPVPEIKQEVLEALFDCPEILTCFEDAVMLYPSGNLAVYVTERKIRSIDDGWTIISDKEEITELNSELEAVRHRIVTACESVTDILDREILRRIAADDQLPPIDSDPLDKKFVESIVNLEHLSENCKDKIVLDSCACSVDGIVPIQYNPNTEQLEITCYGVTEFELSVPHILKLIKEKDPILFQRAVDRDPLVTFDVIFDAILDEIPKPFLPSADETGFVTTESCSDKIGKQIRLTEKKHNQNGYYNEGTVLSISDYSDDFGFKAGTPTNSGFYEHNFINVVVVGFSGFEFVD